MQASAPNFRSGGKLEEMSSNASPQANLLLGIAIGVAVLCMIAWGVWWGFFKNSPASPNDGQRVASVSAASAPTKVASVPNTAPNQLNFHNNPTVEPPPPSNVQESDQPVAKQGAQAPASQPARQAAPAVAQAPAAKVPAQAEAKRPIPAQSAKAAPRKRKVVITEYREPVPVHKAAMGNAGGFVKVASVAPAYYSSKEQCEAAWRAGRAVEYFPTMRSKSYGPARIEGLSLRGGEAPACADMDTAAGRHWVFFSQGREFYTQGAEVKFLAECQNTIHRIVFLKKEEPIAVLPPVPPAPVTPPPCGDCNKTVVEEVTKITKVNEYCEVRGQRFPMVNGQCNVPPVQVTTQGPTVTTPCCARPVPQAPAYVPPVVVPQQPAPRAGCEPNCVPHPHVDITNKVPRTDGRCVVAFKDPRGVVHYARFDTSTKNGDKLLVGAKVDSVAGEWNRSYTPTYVGFGNDHTVRLRGTPSCEAAVTSLKDDRVFAWTAPRLGLDPGCTIVGPVKEL